MANLSIRVPDEEVEEIDNDADAADQSRAEYIRSLIRSRHDSNEAQAELDELQAEYEEQITDLEQEIERLRREQRQILEQREENKELVRYAEQQRSVLERREERRDAPAWRRAKWWLFGRSEE
jgi:TolA-binding protein